MEKYRILVTGANGYIGSKVVKKLCDLNQTVIAVDLNNNFIDKRAIFKCCNIFETEDNWMEKLERPDICIHFAWRDGFVHNSYKHLNDLSLHCNFLMNLVDNGIKKIVVMGSMHEIGYWEGQVTENTPCNPMSYYGIAKNSLRQFLETYCEKKCNLQWLRGFYIYGDDAFGNSIFCKIKKADSENQKYFPFTSGKNQYDFIHVDELVKQIAYTILQNDVLGIINICSGKPVSLGEKIEWYIKENKLNIKLDYNKFPDRKYDSPCIYGANEKIEQILSKMEREI